MKRLHSWSLAQKHRISVDTETTCVLLPLAKTNALLMEMIAAVYHMSPTWEGLCSVLDIVPNPNNRQNYGPSLALQMKKLRLRVVKTLVQGCTAWQRETLNP